MNVVEFNRLSVSEKCRVLKEMGHYVYCMGTKNNLSVNVYSMRTFVVEVGTDMLANSIHYMKARTF